MTTREMHAFARAALKKSTRWVYRRDYVTGVNTVACREPTPHTLSLTLLVTSDYAEAAEVSVPTARAHLRKLVDAGLVTEHKHSRVSGVLRFALSADENEAIGREIIAELVAEGLPFDDDYMATLKGAK